MLESAFGGRRKWMRFAQCSYCSSENSPQITGKKAVYSWNESKNSS
jgi:hypothetical protein